MQTLMKVRFFKQFVELFAELISLSKNEECYLFLFEKVKLAQKKKMYLYNSESIYIALSINFIDYRNKSLFKKIFSNNPKNRHIVQQI